MWASLLGSLIQCLVRQLTQLRAKQARGQAPRAVVITPLERHICTHFKECPLNRNNTDISHTFIRNTTFGIRSEYPNAVNCLLELYTILVYCKICGGTI